jgi:hypothetical protein
LTEDFGICQLGFDEGFVGIDDGGRCRMYCSVLFFFLFLISIFGVI